MLLIIVRVIKRGILCTVKCLCTIMDTFVYNLKGTKKGAN